MPAAELDASIPSMWTTFVLYTSLVSAVHFSAMYVKAMTLKPVQYGQA